MSEGEAPPFRRRFGRRNLGCPGSSAVLASGQIILGLIKGR
jgi:hypothetical protein